MTAQQDDDPGGARQLPTSGDGGRQGTQTPAPPAYEEVTLADLLDVLIRRRVLLVSLFTVVVLATIILTVTATPTYEASATILPTQERDELHAILSSRAFAEDVAEQLGLVGELGGGSSVVAGQAVQARVTVRQGTGQIGDQDRTILTIKAESSTASGAWRLAGGYLDTLPAWRGTLENVTWDKNWQTYYEQAGKNETQATAELQDLVDGIQYYTVLDEPVIPASATSPDWRLNLSLGATLGVMLALFVPFLVEGVVNALEERRRGRR